MAAKKESMLILEGPGVKRNHNVESVVGPARESPAAVATQENKPAIDGDGQHRSREPPKSAFPSRLAAPDRSKTGGITRPGCP